jgi:hypothetical protein
MRDLCLEKCYKPWRASIMKMQKLFLLAGVLLIIIVGCAKQEIKDAAPLAKSMNHSPASADDLVNIADFSDNKVTNWKLVSPIKIYDKKTIFDYIDGAAEIYFAYDFNKVASAEYKNGKTSIMIDIYEMLSPDSAFGIYSLNRYQDANYVNIGNEGILTGTSLDFWKGKYYCKTYCFDKSSVYQKDVSEFASTRRRTSHNQKINAEKLDFKKRKIFYPKTRFR